MPKTDRSSHETGVCRSAASPAESTFVDHAACGIQVLLTALGIHLSLAVGFTLHWNENVLVRLRHPLYGLLLIVFGAGTRWLLSPTYRARFHRHTRSDMRFVQGYAEGETPVPWRAAFVWVFVPAILIYQSNDRTVGSGDSIPALLTAISVLQDADLDLDEFIDPESPPYYVTRMGDHFYSRFALGPSVVGIPFVQVAQWLGADVTDHRMRRRLEKVIASVLASASAAFVFLLTLRLTPPRAAAFLTVFYALGSQNWGISSQALWQHGPVALCVACALWIEYHCRARPSGAHTLAQGALAGMAVACRPTAAIFALVFTILLLCTARRRCPAFLAGASLTLLPFLFIHWKVYGSILGPYYHVARETAWAAEFHMALFGNLISPARGLLVYQPLVLFAAGILVPRLARSVTYPLAIALLVWSLLHLLVISRFSHWWGGHCWGPRFFTELMPAFTVLIAPAASRLLQHRPMRFVLLALLSWSVLLQGIGVYSRSAERWMEHPIDIDHSPERLWQWHDAPFLAPLRPLFGDS